MTRQRCVLSAALSIEISRITPANAGQADPWNRLHLLAFLDLPYYVLTTPIRLDKAEVAGSSPASSTSVVAGIRLLPVVANFRCAS